MPGGSTSILPSTSQDPSPTGLTQGWSCSGSTNAARFCDPVVDSLLDAAVRRRSAARGLACRAAPDRGGRARGLHVRAELHVRREPARFGNVRIRPESPWAALREWTMSGPEPRRPRGQLRCGAGCCAVRCRPLLTLVVAVVLLFLLTHILPGDPLAREGSRSATHARSAERARGPLRARPPAGRPAGRVSRRGWCAETSAPRSSTAGPSPGCSPSGSPPRSCSAARCCCSTSPWASGSACVRRCARDSPRTAGSRRSVARRATPCPRSGLASCWRRWWGCSWRLASVRPACATRCWTAGRMVVAVDVLRHLVLPAAHPVDREHRRDHALPAERHAGGPPPSLYTDRPGQGAVRAPGDLAPRLAERPVSRAHPVRPLAADPGQRLGVRRGGVRLAGTRVAGRDRGR